MPSLKGENDGLTGVAPLHGLELPRRFVATHGKAMGVVAIPAPGSRRCEGRGGRV